MPDKPPWQEIKPQIIQIQAATKEAVVAIQESLPTIEEVSSIATTVASAVEEQGAATSEIVRNVQQNTQAKRVGPLTAASDLSKQPNTIASADQNIEDHKQ